MKTLRQLFSEVAQPRGEDEKHFKDKHITTKKAHPVAPDNVFSGGTKKAPKRLADYDVGEDETVYEASAFDVPTAAGGEYDDEESHVRYKKGNKSKALHKEEKDQEGDDKPVRIKLRGWGPDHKKGNMGNPAARASLMKKEAKMDPVGQEDDDINNDGEVDSSDRYLHRRRRAISKAIKKEATDTQMGSITVTSDEERKKRAQAYRDKKAIKKEEDEQLDELSSKTLHSYVRKALSTPYEYDKEGNIKYTKKILKRQSGAEKALSKMKEEVEELDEISRDLARSYIRKASDQFHGEKNRNRLGDKAKKRSASITLAGKKAYSIPSEPRVRATESIELDEISDKKLDAYRQKAFADQPAGDDGSDKYRKRKFGRDLAFAKQTGRAKVRATKEEVELDEISRSTMDSYLKKARASKGVAGDELQRQSVKMMFKDKRSDAEKERGAKAAHTYGKRSVGLQTAMRQIARKKTNEEIEQIDEVTRSAVKRPVTYTDNTGITRTRYTTTRPVQRDQHGQEKIQSNESFINEAFKAGSVRLNDGSSVSLKAEDAKLLNQMFKDLNERNRKLMKNTLMTDKSGFNEILSFAREAL